MTEPRGNDPASTPMVEVQVFRHGRLVTTDWCDSEDEAAEVVDRWTEEPGVECVVTDLSTRQRDGDVLFEPEAVQDRTDEYRDRGDEGRGGVP